MGGGLDGVKVCKFNGSYSISRSLKAGGEGEGGQGGTKGQGDADGMGVLFVRASWKGREEAGCFGGQRGKKRRRGGRAGEGGWGLHRGGGWR